MVKAEPKDIEVTPQILQLRQLELEMSEMERDFNWRMSLMRRRLKMALNGGQAKSYPRVIYAKDQNGRTIRLECGTKALDD